MTLICKKCGKEYEDSELKCPYCGEAYTEENEIDDILEVPLGEEENKTLEEVKISETPAVVSVEVNAETKENIQEEVVLEETKEEVTKPTIIEEEPVTLTEVTPVVDTLPSIEEEAPVKAEMPIIETPNLDDILPTDTLNNLDETNISNDNLETISVELQEETLEEKEEVFEIPEMPAPEVGEVDLEQLINKYDNDEKENLEKIEAKKQYDEAVSEQKRLEEEAKRQQPVPKPDLLATIPDETDVDIDIKTTKKKGKKPMKKVMNAILVILIIAVIGVLIWYFIQGRETKENNNYMKPVDEYFSAYKAGDSTKMLASFVPCVSQTDEITTLITTTVNNSAQYGVITLEYKETTTEVVNKDDQKHLDEYLKNMCPTSTPAIEEYKHVFVEQKIKGQEEKEFTVNNPEFWVVKVNNEWYILQIQ
ncbi:MAG: zinc ribbon domain-containing protein [Bacilli bacterium]|nr:zinc ribbon domain-containing protein [Bacilli bacterium]